MSDGTTIEWTDASWNPIRAMHSTPNGVKLGWHCEHKSEGCRNCYAEGFNRRLGTGFAYKPGHLVRPNPMRTGGREGEVSLFLDEKMLELPLRWKKSRKIFVGSMTDLFADFVTDEWLDQIFAVMALAPQHIFQLLTKRPERMRAYISGEGLPLLSGRLQRIQDAAYRIAATRHGQWDEAAGMAARQACIDALERIDARTNAGFANVWLGVSVEDQAAADERIPILLDTPAAIRWLSMEPLLGPVDLSEIEHAPAHCIHALWGLKANTDGTASYGPKIDWVVAGGESGAGARPMHPDWVRRIRNQCAASDVPFLFKQWGAWAPVEDDADTRFARQWVIPPTASRFGPINRATDALMHRSGKKLAGRALDGVEHNGYPA